MGERREEVPGDRREGEDKRGGSDRGEREGVHGRHIDWEDVQVQEQCA